MIESGFKCPKCGQTVNFVAQAMLIDGPVDIHGFGYEERIGHGLNYSIPNDALMECCECGHEARAWEFAKCCADAWWPEEKEEA